MVKRIEKMVAAESGGRKLSTRSGKAASTGGRQVVSTVKESSSEFRNSMSPAS